MKNLKLLFISSFVLIFSHGCIKKEGILGPKENNNLISFQIPINDDGPMILGSKLLNPYSVSNMKIAFNNLVIRGELTPQDFNIRPTHNYVRFSPENEQELETLKDDPMLILYDYPLDFQIIKAGVYYRDPTINDDRPTFQYASVEVNQPLPPIKKIILEELYIPEEVEDARDSLSVDKLVDEALKITNNLTDIDGSPAEISFRRPSRWNPSGRIRIMDEALDALIPLEGAKVRARRWFTTKEDYTDASGRFRTGDFRRQVNYSIKWERDDYDIRSGSFGQAILDGPRMKAVWNHDIHSGVQKFYGHIHRGAFDYYQNYWRFNLTSPPRNSPTRPKLNIGAYNENNDESNGSAQPSVRLFGIRNVIKIYNPNRDAVEVYGTTVHEVGHYSHWGFDKNNYNNGADQVVESWAEGVEWVFVNWRYSILTGQPFVYFWNYQNKTVDETEYTSLVVDLMDNLNQSNSSRFIADPCNCDGDFDGQNCFVDTAPNGSTAFIYGANGNGSFYYTPINGNQCPLQGSYFDGANCFVENIPNGCIPFIHNNSFYIARRHNAQFPFDHVEGYSIEQIEQALRGAGSFDEWEQNLKDQYNNPTEKYLDELFGSWN